MCTDRRAPCGRQAGLTLIELILSLVIVGVGLAFLLSVVGASIRTSADPMQRKQALAVAESMLHEISAKDYANPAGGFTGAATPGNRALFDDIGDYDGYASSGVYSIDGVPVPALSGYDVAVMVSAAGYGSVSLPIASTAARLVTVTVTYPGGSIALSTYRTAYAPDA